MLPLRLYRLHRRARRPRRSERRSSGWWIGDLFAMLLGWSITAAATSLAPFWFDTLKRFTSIRSSGKPPEERPLSPKEVSQPTEPGQSPKEADLLDALKR